MAGLQFENPSLLWFLLLLAIPIFIHLFNFKRYKKVFFSNLDFLKNISQQTKKTSKLKHWLILVSRLLFILFVVLAFAKPKVEHGTSNAIKLGKKKIAIYIDNSFSMGREGSKGVLFQSAKLLARDIAKGFKATDRYLFIDNDFSKRAVRYLAREDFMSELSSSEISSNMNNMSSWLNEIAAQNAQNEVKPDVLYVISDFQKQSSDFDHFDLDTNIQIRLIPLENTNAQNYFLDSCWLEEARILHGKKFRIHYRIQRIVNDGSREINVKLLVNNQTKGLNNISFSGLSYESYFDVIPDGEEIQWASIQIEDFPIMHDDRLYFSLPVDQKVQVVEIKSKNANPFLTKLFGNDSLVEFNSYLQDRVDRNAMEEANLIILNALNDISMDLLDDISAKLGSHTKLAFIPSSEDISANITFNKYFGLNMNMRVDTQRIHVNHLNLESPIFKNVFQLDGKKLPSNVEMPYSKFHYVIDGKLSFYTDAVMVFANETPALVEAKTKKAPMYYFLMNLDQPYSDFSENALVVPVFYNMALQAVQIPKIYYRANTNTLNLGFSLAKSEKPPILQSLDNSQEYLPPIISKSGVSIMDLSQFNAIGQYKLLDGKKTWPISVNYSKSESYTQFLTKNDIKEKLRLLKLNTVEVLEGDQEQIIQEAVNPITNNGLWKLFMFFGLLFLVIELFLLRFLK